MTREKIMPAFLGMHPPGVCAGLGKAEDGKPNQKMNQNDANLFFFGCYQSHQKKLNFLIFSIY